MSEPAPPESPSLPLSLLRPPELAKPGPRFTSALR